MFAAGAAIGSAVTWKIVKDKYEKIVQEELDSIREVFGDIPVDVQEDVDDDDGESEYEQINWDDLEDLDEEEDAESDDDMSEYARLLNNYTKKEGGAENMAKEPYVISPYDFGEIDGYRTIDLTYYTDGILEDEDGNIVTDADELIGPKALTTFGEYEDDSVFVRNEGLRTDFEILKDYRTYDEANTIGPKQVGNE
jgi:hypothetical protein